MTYLNMRYKKILDSAALDTLFLGDMDPTINAAPVNLKMGSLSENHFHMEARSLPANVNSLRATPCANNPTELSVLFGDPPAGFDNSPHTPEGFHLPNLKNTFPKSHSPAGLFVDNVAPNGTMANAVNTTENDNASSVKPFSSLIFDCSQFTGNDPVGQGVRDLPRSKRIECKKRKDPKNTFHFC